MHEPHLLQLIRLPAVLSDLSTGPSEGANVPHLDHGGNEIRVEGARACAVG